MTCKFSLSQCIYSLNHTSTSRGARSFFYKDLIYVVASYSVVRPPEGPRSTLQDMLDKADIHGDKLRTGCRRRKTNRGDIHDGKWGRAVEWWGWTKLSYLPSLICRAFGDALLTTYLAGPKPVLLFCRHPSLHHLQGKEFIKNCSKLFLLPPAFPVMPGKAPLNTGMPLTVTSSSLRDGEHFGLLKLDFGSDVMWTF